MEFLLIAVLVTLTFLCVTGEIRSFKDRRKASELLRRQAAKRIE